MRSESEIRQRLERIENSLDNSSGHDMSHLIGQRNMLLWVLNEDDTEHRGAVRTGQERW